MSAVNAMCCAEVRDCGMCLVSQILEANRIPEKFKSLNNRFMRACLLISQPPTLWNSYPRPIIWYFKIFYLSIVSDSSSAFHHLSSIVVIIREVITGTYHKTLSQAAFFKKEKMLGEICAVLAVTFGTLFYLKCNEVHPRCRCCGRRRWHLRLSKAFCSIVNSKQ